MSDFQLDFIGLGVMRCSTTWVARCLAEHPEIYMPPSKELFYFSSRERMYKRDLSGLARFFKGWGDEKLIGEYSSMYLHDGIALDRLRKTHPDAKYIVSLRDPVARMFSEYQYLKYNRKMESAATLDEALHGPNRERYLQKSRYSDVLSHAQEMFPNLHVIVDVDLHAKPQKVVRDLYSFMGVRPGFVPSVLKETINPSQPGRGVAPSWWAAFIRFLVKSNLPASGSIHRYFARPINGVIDRFPDTTKETLTAGERKRLFNKYFDDDVTRLEAALGRSLSAWRP